MTRLRTFYFCGMVSFLPLVTSLVSGGPRLEMGWTDGAAGEGIKFVHARVESVNFAKGDLVLRYDWKHGKVTLHKIAGNRRSVEYKGTWAQDGDESGDAYLRFDRGINEAVGYWTKRGATDKLGLCLRAGGTD